MYILVKDDFGRKVATGNEIAVANVLNITVEALKRAIENHELISNDYWFAVTCEYCDYGTYVLYKQYLLDAWNHQHHRSTKKKLVFE